MLAVGQEKVNIVDQSIIKTVGAFGGGIAGSGQTCGTLLGGIALISSLYSKGNSEEKEDPRTWSLSKKFLEKFVKLTKQYGSINCKDIAKVDWSDKNAAKNYYSNPESNRKVCIQLVGDAAFALGELLEKEV